MFAIAPFSPANSPVIRSPLLPETSATPPPMLEPSAPTPLNSPPSPSPPPEASPAPSVTSPTSSVPPPALPPTGPRPSNSAPPVNAPPIQVPPAFTSPSPPEIPLVPASSPPIPSNENPNPPPVQSPPSPAILIPPAVPFPSPETPASAPPPLSSRHRKVSPARPSPTATSPPPSPLALPEAKPAAPETTSPPPPVTFFPSTEPPLSPRAAPAPSLPTVPEISPEMKSLPPALVPTTSPAPPSSRSFPVAVEVEKHSEFNMSSGVIVGIVIVGIVLVLVVAVVLVLCRKNSNKKKQKNLYTHQRKEPSPYVGSKGSHVIRVLSNNDPSHHLTEGGGAFGSVNCSGDVTAVPNHAASIAFGSVNGIFTYDELVVATNGFSEANILGEGGFGYVYKGVLPCGKEIAVKQLKTGSQQGEREFQAEVETISRVHHKHLVELVGYCITRAERLLVYEFVPNSTLEFHLHGEGKPVVDWEKRIKVALGSAKGLAYLHEDCNPAIIHRDIKASNILLDFNFEAKVSDFGLAKIFPSTDGCITHLITRVVGTFGYLAPEYASSGKLTDKSDVYSYGVMLLELITGRPPITAAGTRNENLVDWARPLLAQVLQDGDFNNLVDPRLQKNYEADEMTRMITCAAACVRHSARLRPRMSQIAGALEGMITLTDLLGDITPGQTTLYSWSDSSNYDARQYQQDLRNFNLALSFQKYSTSGHSESTSAYGLHLSDSSSEVQQTSQDIQ